MAQIIQTTKIKGTCIICNNMPVDETKATRPPLPMFHAVGVDVNWGEDCNVCQICAGVMADLMQRIDPERYQRLVTQHEELQESFVELQERFDEQKQRIGEILAGRKAAAKQRSAA